MHQMHWFISGEHHWTIALPCLLTCHRRETSCCNDLSFHRGAGRFQLCDAFLCRGELWRLCVCCAAGCFQSRGFGMCITNVIGMVAQGTVGLQLLLQVFGIEVRHWAGRTCGHALSHTLLPGCSCIMSAEIVLFR